MTDKELNYMEDAIMHESSIINIINESIKYLNDNNLVSFMTKELEAHQNMHKKLLTNMEEKIDE